jgi:hypothetical protein
MGVLYGFATVLGSLERAGLRRGRLGVTVMGSKVFCFFLAKETLSCLGFRPQRQEAVLF